MTTQQATARPARKEIAIKVGLTYRGARNANGTPQTSTGYAVIDSRNDGVNFTFAEFQGWDSFQGSYLEHVPVSAAWIRANRK